MRSTLCALIIVLVAGCGNLSGILDALGLDPNSVTLRLVNETAFPVEPSVYVSSVGDLWFDAITEEFLAFGINLQNIAELNPGEVVTRRYDCDEIKAVMASDAELKTGLGLSPDDDTEVFTEGDDFECGDTITIRYSGGVANFNAQISAASFDPLVFFDLLGGL